MKTMRIKIIMISIMLIFSASYANAGWKDVVGGLLNKNIDMPNTQKNHKNSNITYAQKRSALKEALKMGVKYAISNLSKHNGFLNNPYVKIPIPNNMQMAAKALRGMGQGKIVDNFVAEMNHAAEKAAPKTINIFMRAIKRMSIHDATKILTGPDNAATEYFKKHTYSSLFKAIKPIVKQSTSKTEVTKYYKEIVDKYKKYKKPIDTLSSYKNLLMGKGSSNSNNVPSDLDTYITKKAIDGIFFMIAKEEEKIRKNPAARTTELLKKVFGSL